MALQFHKSRDDPRFYDGFADELIIHSIQSKLGPINQTHKKILVLGCRDEKLVTKLLIAGYNAKGMDIRDDYIQDSPDWFIHANAANIPLKDNSIDLIISRLFFDDLIGLQELDEQEVHNIYTSQCHKILRPDGLILSHGDRLPLGGGEYFNEIIIKNSRPIYFYQVKK
jgi:SAM-dependent methyltransferase